MIHNARHLFFFLKNRELDELYLSVFLRNIAGSLINIFVPIYLLQSGLVLSQVALFYLVHIVTQTIFFPIGAYLSQKIGVKKTMALGILAQVFFYLSLYFLDPSYYLLPALIFTLAGVLYWPAYHIEFAQSMDARQEAKEVSFMHVISLAAVMLGPFIGGLLILGSSFFVVFSVVSLLMILATVPLVFTKDTKCKSGFSYKNILRGNKKNAISHFGEGLDSYAGMILWPLFIYLSLLNVVSLGGIVSFASVILMLYLLWLGPKVDGNKYFVLRIGVWMNFFAWFARTLFITPIGLLLTNLFGSVSFRTLELPVQKHIYENAEKSIEYLYFREVFLNIGRGVILLIPLFGLPIIWSFYVAGLASFLFLLQKSSRSSRASR